MKIKGLVPPSQGFAWPTLPVDPVALVNLTRRMIGLGIGYQLGAKPPSLKTDASEIKRLDCSGFVRYAIYQASGITVPDGSVVMHDAIRDAGCKRTAIESGQLRDGAVRIAFLPPIGKTPGHVVLILDGQTLECRGGHGVDRRPWTGDGWQGRCAVYVLTKPKGVN